MRVLAVGWANLDQRYYVEAFPPTKSRTGVRAYRETLGGPAAVAAQAVARLGGSARLLSRWGKDPAGARLRAMLEAEGVEVHLQLGDATPVSAVLVTPVGERYIFPYRPPLPTGLELDPVRLLEGVGAVLLDGRWPEAGQAVGALARARGLPVVLDLDRNRAPDWSLVTVASHVVASEELALEHGGIELLLDRLAKQGVFAAVTLGARGVVYEGGHLPAHRLEVQDTTGAGDVFHGAFALALAEGQAASVALRFANAAAALHCARGSPPSRQAVEALLG
ncbi:carbohydrate kinase [Meiothermus sp. QL-1]|uniref:PfkB family carbohydrate kinase n=1 Tax=Meiothermus sp. QL-1 TaxID=2058095 RepID=UPI000E0A6DB0|nr:PfkB family carbohydrate kinase [Meiothermus sp. QL-1]RDI95221.1 carbohydrate kinase [Meiothermus sp. QL-1]